ncbi:MAG: PTS transporter subunit EIIC [Defluviitaleaceae bacterium]|nr:PTS transporter subunit EIIC [Defluviitaleaceae bacterium]
MSSQTDTNQSKFGAKLEAMTEKITTGIMPFAEKMQSYSFIGALSETFMILMPIFIIGSFAVLLAFVDIGPWQAIMAEVPAVRRTFQFMQFTTLSLIAFYVLLILPYRYASRLGMKEALAVMPITVASFLAITPTELYSAIPAGWLGHQGLLTAVLMSFLVVRVTKFFLDKRICIRMPAGVPKFVEDGFSVMVPGVVLVGVFAVINHLFAQTELETAHNIIYRALQIPLQRVGLSLFGLTLTQTLSTLFMFVGLHASTIVGFTHPIQQAAGLENLEAWQAGLPLPNVAAWGISGFMSIGAGGNMLSATLSVLLFSRSKRFKSIGKVAIVPGIFGIGEPMLFGLPVMLNPLLFIPFIFVTFFNTIVAYLIISVGLVGRFTGVMLPWTTPPIINVFLSSSTPVRAVIAQLIIIAINLMIWYPFIRSADKVALKEEEALVAAGA